MRTRLILACLTATCLTGSTAAAQLMLGAKPVRVILLVDSSSAVGSMINPIRAALNAFLDGLPDDADVGFITAGGQIRIRTQPTRDRDRLHKAANGFASDGGGNAFLDTLLESDQRFLKKATRGAGAPTASFCGGRESDRYRKSSTTSRPTLAAPMT